MQIRVRTFIQLLFFYGILTGVGLCQDQTSRRYFFEDDKVSFEMPAKIRHVYDEAGFYYDRVSGRRSAFRNVHLINAAEGFTYLSLERYSVDSPTEYVDELLSSKWFKKKKVDSGNGEVKVVDMTIDGLDEFPDYDARFTARYIATKAQLYIATVWSRGPSDALADKFLNSITASVVQGSTASGTADSIALRTATALKISDFTGSISATEAEKLTDRDSADGSQNGRLWRLYTPWAGNYEPTNNIVSNGTVRLLVRFGSEGYVDDVKLISGIRGNGNRNSLFSVLRMKFLPRFVNGKTVSTYREVAFRF